MYQLQEKYVNMFWHLYHIIGVRKRQITKIGNIILGMDDLEEWFYTQSSTEHRQHALNWRHCKSDASRKHMVKQTGVRWSELLRLQYFDLIRFIIIDLMHCLFLGIARWIVK